ALRGSHGRGAWATEFIEKPERARAEALVAGGEALWNSGIFAWRASAILAALRLHLPEVVGPLERAGTSPRALAAAYRRLPAVSIDHGVLERAERVAVVRARFPWSDVGSWAAVAALWSGGNGRNALRGRTVSIDSRGCLVDSPERLVAVLGVDDLVVVDTPDAVLVCRTDRAQDVRLVAEAVEHLRQLARQGTLIYVMRYRSALDYLLVNAVLLREGLPLARFAPGVSTVAFRPLGELLGWLFRRRRRAGGGHVACS